MELKNKNLASSVQALTELASIPFNAKLSYWIGKTLGKVRSAQHNVQSIINEQIKKLGAESKEGMIEVKKENEKEFDEFVNKIQEEDVVLEGIREIKLSELGDAQIKPSALANLDWLIINDIKKGE